MTDPVHDFFLRHKGIEAGYDSVASRDNEMIPPPPPAYASTMIPGWGTVVAYDSVVPLKTVSPARLDLHRLRAMGATELRLLGPGLLPYIDEEKLRRERQQSSPCLRRPGSPYLRQLLEFDWARHAPRDARRSTMFASKGFPVLKEGGTSTRFVADCIINRVSTAPTKVVFPRFEEVHDQFLWFRGGREDDAVSWYGQFSLDPCLMRFFAIMCGAVTIMMTVMVQGWGPATRVAQQALAVIYAVAHEKVPQLDRAFFGYVDNACTLSNSTEDDAVLLKAVKEVHENIKADFVYGTWSTTVPFIGMTMTTNDDGTKSVSLKESWRTRALTFLNAVASAEHVNIDTKRQVVGVTLWAVRVMRHALAEIAVVIEWIKADNDFTISPKLAKALQQVIEWMNVPSQLPPLNTYKYVVAAAVDATPDCIAAEVWSPKVLPNDCLRDFVCRTSNPFPVFTVDFLRRHMREIHRADIFSHRIQTRRTINGTELLGILVAVLLCVERAILIVFTDSMVAKAWVRRGLSRSTAATFIVEHIVTAVRHKKIRLLLVHVPSEKNPSDKYSRDRQDVQGLADDVGLAALIDEIGDVQVTSWL
jgi:hypothetical protein